MILRRYMLDTNILSDVIKNPKGKAAKRIAANPPEALLTSIVVAAEMRFGIEKKGSDVLSARVEALQPGHSDRNSDWGDYSDARERILALGLPTQPAQHPGPQSGGQPPQTRRDRSLEALQR